MKTDKAKMACNKPKRTPGHATKSHVVKACGDALPVGGKLIRFSKEKKLPELISADSKKEDGKV